MQKFFKLRAYEAGKVGNIYESTQTQKINKAELEPQKQIFR